MQCDYHLTKTISTGLLINFKEIYHIKDKSSSNNCYNWEN